MSLKSWILLFFFGFSIQGLHAWQLIDGHSVKILSVSRLPIIEPWPYPNDPLLGQKFSVLIIAQNNIKPNDSSFFPLWEEDVHDHYYRLRGDLRERQYMSDLFAIFKAHVVQEYRGRKLDVSADTIQAEGDFFDGRSALVAVTAYNDLSKIYDMIRVSNGDVLPMERRMQDLLPPSEIHRARLPPIQLREIEDNGRKILLGGRSEIKSWIKKKGSDLTLMPMLIYFAARFGIFEEYHRAVRWKGRLLPVRNTEFVLETESPPELYQRIINSLGVPLLKTRGDLFDIVDTFPEDQWRGTSTNASKLKKRQLTWMRTDLERFQAILMAMSFFIGMKDIGNSRLATEENWQPDFSLSDRCASILQGFSGQPIPFFNPN